MMSGGNQHDRAKSFERDNKNSPVKLLNPRVRMERGDERVGDHMNMRGNY